MKRADEIMQALKLVPHPEEGGFYRETYRERATTKNSNGEPRNLNTAIYYLLTPETFSEMHRLPSTEVFHFYAGDPVEMLNLTEKAEQVVRLGSDVLAGHSPQHVVPGGTWQGCRLISGGEYALLGCTVTPGFAFEDYERGWYKNLAPLCLENVDLLRALCRV